MADVLTALEGPGYTTIPLLDAGALTRVRALWDLLAVPADTAYYTTNVHASRAVARAVDLELKAIAGPRAEQALPGFTPFLAAFISKGAHSGSVELHPDWTYTDERRHRTYLFWCPLVDTDVDNGTLGVVPGSHRWMDGLRGSGDFPNAVEAVGDQLRERLVPVPLRAGEAIVYDAALIHGSPPNHSDWPRTAMALAVAPVGAGLVHFHRRPGGPTDGYAIDDAWYTVQPFGEPPAGYPSVDPWTEPQAPLSPHRLALQG